MEIGGRGDLHGAGWYMNILADTKEDAWFAIYPGQSISMEYRVPSHKRAVQKETTKSLHYFV
jgi:hypothetical protein